MRIKLAATLALPCIALAPALRPAAAADVTLTRGAFAETVSVDAGTAPLPAVLRGARPLPAAGRTRPAPKAAAAPPARRIVVAGEVLWVFEPTLGRLRACWLRATGLAGQNRIYCTAAD